MRPASAVDAEGQAPHLARPEDLGEELWQDPAQHQVGVRDRQVAALLVAHGPGVRASAVGADGKEAGAEVEAGAAAGGDGVDVQLRRLRVCCVLCVCKCASACSCALKFSWVGGADEVQQRVLGAPQGGDTHPGDRSNGLLLVATLDYDSVCRTYLLCCEAGRLRCLSGPRGLGAAEGAAGPRFINVVSSITCCMILLFVWSDPEYRYKHKHAALLLTSF